MSLLATRHHLATGYFVLAPAPSLWGGLALPGWKLLLLLGLVAAWMWAGLRRADSDQSVCPPPVRWLLAAWAIPAVDALRLLGATIPYSFVEPLGLAFVGGSAVAGLIRDPVAIEGRLLSQVRPAGWQGIVWLVTLAAAAWWYWQGLRAYADFLLGYHDFGHFALRVANTWNGLGFLHETPGLPAFWDHFNPGLALLAPLWGLWPDAKLFLALQALCLATPAPLVYGIGRAWGVPAPAAAAWALSYLAIPSVGQLNLNYSYGWHPVSLALPIAFLAVWLLLQRQRALAAVAVVWACSYEETVVVAVACLAFAWAAEAWWLARCAPAPQTEGTWRIAGHLPAWGWATLGAVLVLAFLVMYRWAGFAQFQTARFSNLGNTAGEILASPLLRPWAFWGQVLRPGSAWFVLALTVPLGLPAVVRGWRTLLAAALPMGVLLAWQRPAANSFAFQYVTMLIPVVLLAAFAGAAPRSASAAAPPPAPAGWLVDGATALVAGLTASTLFGSLPWSSPTLSVLLAQTYQTEAGLAETNPRAVETEANAALREIVARVGGRDAAVLATGRIAAHLLQVRRLESVEMAAMRWNGLQQEAGAGRSAVEVFDWLVLDTYEHFQQSPDKVRRIQEEAQRVGYQCVHSTQGINVWARPGLQAGWARPTARR